MAFKDTGRWQEQLCGASNDRISGGSSSGLSIFVEDRACGGGSGNVCTPCAVYTCGYHGMLTLTS